jgi:quinol monooxygenase YgiN
MPTHYANLDALIRREDFEVKSEAMLSPAQLASTIQISQLEKGNLWYQVLRKPGHPFSPGHFVSSITYRDGLTALPWQG